MRKTGTILDEIVERKRRDVAERKKHFPVETLQARAKPSLATLDMMLAQPGLSLIAEIKRKSPSKGMLREKVSPKAIAEIYQAHDARALSVLTDEPYFGGSFSDLAEARSVVKLPILAKDFTVDPYQIVEARVAGADAVLLLASVLTDEEIDRFMSVAGGPSLLMNTIVEVATEEELDRVLAMDRAGIVGINQRDLKTMTIDRTRVLTLGPKVKAAGRILVAESGFETRAQIEEISGLADAVLIGSTFMSAPDIEAKLTELGW